jgi:polyferredoxin
MLALAGLMLWHGFAGPAFAPKNLATTLAWVHYRGVLVGALLLAGNVSCLACPLMLVRDWARRWLRPSLSYPRLLRNKWLAGGLFAAGLFAYELSDVWASPRGTAWLIVAYFSAAVGIDVVFKHAAFCKFVCPIGQFSFTTATLSPVEVRVQDQAVCTACKTRDCIRGSAARAEPGRARRGCELALYQPRKAGNLDCTFCLDCVHACPHQNVGLQLRVPAEELWTPERRSSIGRLSERTDLAVFSLLFSFGAVFNAFAMTGPVYALEAALARSLDLEQEAPALALIAGFALILEPLLLVAAAAALSKALSASRATLLATATRYAYALIPLGVGVWFAHFSFHFLTGLWSFVPVLGDMLAEWGVAAWDARTVRSVGLTLRLVRPIEVGSVALGVLMSCVVALRRAQADGTPRACRAALPWMALATLQGAAAAWLLTLPMEMRGVELGD